MVRKLSKTIEINFHKLRRELWGKSTEVAQMLGIAPQSLSRKLQEHHKLTLDELNRIALHLGRDVSDFLLFKESTQLDEANHSKEVIMNAEHIVQNIRQFKESISSSFEQLFENRSEAERGELIKELENLVENCGLKAAISPLLLEQLLKDSSEPERSAIVEALEEIIEGLLQHDGAKVAISLDLLLENRSEAKRVELIKVLENLLQHSSVKATISPQLLDEILESRSKAERSALIAAFGETPQDIASGLEERSGFTSLTIDEIVLLSDNGVEIEWLKELHKLGFTNLTVNDIVRLSDNGVEVEWLKELHKLEFTNLTIDEIMLLSDNGVEIEWLKELHKLGFTNLTVNDIVRLSDNGVEIEWLKGIRELGLIGEHMEGDHRGDDHDDSHHDDHNSHHSNEHRS